MCDPNLLCPPKKLKFEGEIKVQSEPSKFLQASFVQSNKVALTLIVSNKFLYEVSQHHTEFHCLSYTDIFLSQLDYVSIQKSKRLDKRVSALVSTVKSKCKELNRTKGASERKSYLKKLHEVAILESELNNVRDIELKLDTVNRELDTVKRDLLDIQVKYDKVLKELVSSTLKGKEQAVRIEQLESDNHHLFMYLETKLGSGLPINRGQDYEKVGKQQKRRKLVNLKQHVSGALWFADTYGLEPASLTLKTKEGGEKVKIDLTGEHVTSLSYFDLPADDREKVQQLSYILDKFSVSDTVYHELHMLEGELPQLRLIGQVRSDMSSVFEIKRLPGKKHGAYVSFKKEVARVLNVSDISDAPPNTKVSFGGDGTEVSRVSSFVNFSFRVIDGETSSPQKTVAVVKVPEKAEMLCLTCRPVFEEVNECRNYIDLYLSGDKKFQNTILGLPISFGSAYFCCNHCKVSKTDLTKTNLPWDYYDGPDMARTLDSMEVGKYGQLRDPMLQIKIVNIVMCILHMGLRGTDVFETNVIDECKQLDHEDKVHKRPATHIKRLEKLINESVTFQIHEKTEKGKTFLTWTSLTGDPKRKLLKELPAKLKTNPPLLHPETVDTVIKIWQDFDALLDLIENPTGDEDFHLKVFEAAHLWLETFLSLQGIRLGYDRCTWYMHDIVWHVPGMLKRLRNLEWFSGQTLEKNNDAMKIIHQRKTRKWDPTVEALTVKKRLERGDEMELAREKHAYNKSNKDWWEHGIFLAKKRQRSQIDDEIAKASCIDGQDSTEERCDPQHMTAEELKQKLVELGVQTRLKKREKLLALYLMTLTGAT